jgi:hypothetical protein
MFAELKSLRRSWWLCHVEGYCVASCRVCRHRESTLPWLQGLALTATASGVHFDWNVPNKTAHATDAAWECTQGLSRTSGILALIVHDADDREIPYEHARKFRSIEQRIWFHDTHKLGHRRIVQNSLVIGRVVDFLKD